MAQLHGLPAVSFEWGLIVIHFRLNLVNLLTAKLSTTLGLLSMNPITANAAGCSQFP